MRLLSIPMHIALQHSPLEGRRVLLLLLLLIIIVPIIQYLLCDYCNIVRPYNTMRHAHALVSFDFALDLFEATCSSSFRTLLIIHIKYSALLFLHHLVSGCSAPFTTINSKRESKVNSQTPLDTNKCTAYLSVRWLVSHAPTTLHAHATDLEGEWISLFLHRDLLQHTPSRRFFSTATDWHT